MEKKCKRCGETKDVSEFYSFYKKSKADKNKKWKYYDSICKKCKGLYTAERSKEIKQKAIEYLGGKCADCGIVDDPCIYDFHHVDPSKKELAFGTRGGKTFEKLKKELDKCVLLCANCHRKRHSKLIQIASKE